jgi:hypothetical membrane protein
MNSPNPARIAAAGTAATLVYPVLVIVLQYVQRQQYHPAREAISVLALGRDGWLMTVAFCSLALGSGVLAWLMHRITQSRIGAALLGISALLTALSAFVHADPESAKTTSLHGTVHQFAGILTFLVIIVAMFVLAPKMRAQSEWRRLGTVTRVFAAAGIPAFLLVPVLGNEHMGVAQRVLIGLLLAWNAATQLYVSRRLSTVPARGKAELVRAA